MKNVTFIFILVLLLNVTGSSAVFYNTSIWSAYSILFKPADPVKIESFTGDLSRNSVRLKWEASNEKNNKGYEVQRRSGSGAYKSIAFIQTKETSNDIQKYIYMDKNLKQGRYTFRLKQVDVDGKAQYSEEVEVSVETPSEFVLGQNFPNPFNPATSISYSLPVDSKVILRVFNVLGQHIITLVDGEMQAGEHEVIFHASSVPDGIMSGVYLYKLEVNGNDGSNFVSTKKMILTK